jgi:hypothetical protein
MNDTTHKTEMRPAAAHLYGERVALASRLEYVAVLRQRLDADAAAIAERLGEIKGELARLEAEEPRLVEVPKEATA